jgi:hypothetical protein
MQYPLLAESRSRGTRATVTADLWGYAMNSIDDDKNQILTVHRRWWHANEQWDIPLMRTCFPVGPNDLMFNFNWHPYFGIEEKVQLWEYYKESGMTMDPPEVRLMKFEVIGDIAYIANEF